MKLRIQFLKLLSVYEEQLQKSLNEIGHCGIVKAAFLQEGTNQR
jgi:hypothetical protein